MHRSQALCGAFTMRRRAVPRPETGRFLSGGTLAMSSSLYVTGARGRTPGAGCQLLPRARTGSSRARYGVVPGTADQPLSDDRYGGRRPRVLTTEHAAGEPFQPETRRGGMNTAVQAPVA
jgi:hypothetical protein